MIGPNKIEEKGLKENENYENELLELHFRHPCKMRDLLLIYHK